MSPILTDNQRKRVAKWMTDVIFGYVLRLVLPWIMSLVAIAILSLGVVSIVAFLVYQFIRT
jgi:hypothetical protein